MARHHIRDDKGNLHIFNDSEYKEYKKNKFINGCLIVFFFIIVMIAGQIGKGDEDKKDSPPHQVEKVVNSKVETSSKKSVSSTDIEKIQEEQSQTEEFEDIEHSNAIEGELNSTVQDITPKGSIQNIEESNINDASKNETNPTSTVKTIHIDKLMRYSTGQTNLEDKEETANN